MPIAVASGAWRTCVPRGFPVGIVGVAGRPQTSGWPVRHADCVIPVPANS